MSPRNAKMLGAPNLCIQQSEISRGHVLAHWLEEVENSFSPSWNRHPLEIEIQLENMNFHPLELQMSSHSLLTIIWTNYKQKLVIESNK
jgi:hypothetical protein